jgi:diguanylate cyclase (GGDEF)-like protein
MRRIAMTEKDNFNENTGMLSDESDMNKLAVKYIFQVGIFAVAAYMIGIFIKTNLNMQGNPIEGIIDVFIVIIIITPLTYLSLKHLNNRRMIEERLKKVLEDDFRQTVKNLQNIVINIEKNKDGEYCFTLVEGKIAYSLGIETEKVLNKPLSEVLSERLSNTLSYYAMRAFKGETISFDLNIKGLSLYLTLSPIFNGDKINKIVGSAIDVTEQRKAEEKAQYLAYYDSVTELPNRALCKERLRHAISHAHRSEKLLAILFLDLDRFNVVNDTLGHAAGDNLLKQVGLKLQECMREDELVARTGGDEFLLLLPELSSDKDVANIAGYILNVFKQPFIIADKEIFVSASMGICFYPYDGRDVEALFKNADTALYRAKEGGRNNYQFYASKMNDKALERLSLEQNLRKAVERNELFLLYQPRVSLKSGKIVGVEALIRWNHTSLGTISPAEFIPLAEESGLIVPIGEWVLRTACLQNKAWHDKGYTDLRMAVNISPKQFKQCSLAEIIKSIIHELGIGPEFLELEITESCMVENTEVNLNVIQNLKSIGLDISVDDFGTGFSSLNYLKQFKVDFLKVDQSFVNGIPEDPNDMAITTAIINMAHSLNLSVVAEGVETMEQMEFLRKNDCDEIQGYYFSRPVRAEEIEKMIIEGKNLF